MKMLLNFPGDAENGSVCFNPQTVPTIERASALSVGADVANQDDTSFKKEDVPGTRRLTDTEAALPAQERGDGDTPLLNLFVQLDMSAGGLQCALPEEVIPQRHMEPTWNDTSIRTPALTEVFSGDLRLTDPNGGIRSQKINRNIAEIADAICHRYDLASVGNQLAVYQQPKWEVMGKEDAIGFIVDAVRSLFNSDAKYLDCQQRNELYAHMLHHEDTRRLKVVPAPDYNYMCCQDYLYDWHTGELVPHDSSHLRFSSLAFNAEEIGTGNGEYWEQFLDNLTGGDGDIRQRILEVIGVILTGYPSKSFFLLQGERDTGKTQLANFLRDLLGTEACFALNDISQLGDKWTTGSIFGKLLCLCGDVPNVPLSSNAIGTIKQLTGGDLIRGVFKYKNPFTFSNTAKLLFVSNYPLQVPQKSREDALLSRLITIPCRNPVSPDRRIEGLHRVLHQEAGYIVGLAMEALREFESRNGVFTPLPEAFEGGAIQATDDEQEVMEFVQSCCEFDLDANCTTDELFQGFQSYAPDSLLGKAQFSKQLLQLYPQVQSSRTKSARGYKGIRLISE